MLGGVSAIFWSLMIVVSLKYVVARAARDQPRRRRHHGAARARAVGGARRGRGSRAACSLVGVFGAALFYGDAVLTPAISVLSAVEGLEVGTEGASSPTSCRSRSASLVGAVRAAALRHRASSGCCSARYACCGSSRSRPPASWNIAQEPRVLAALDPRHALRSPRSTASRRSSCSGSVLLAFTGAEALYADVGHFGKRAVRLAWFAVVAPALVLNYFGQGALLIAHPEAIDEPVLPRVPRLGAVPDGRRSRRRPRSSRRRRRSRARTR